MYQAASLAKQLGDYKVGFNSRVAPERVEPDGKHHGCQKGDVI